MTRGRTVMVAATMARGRKGRKREEKREKEKAVGKVLKIIPHNKSATVLSTHRVHHTCALTTDAN